MTILPGSCEAGKGHHVMIHDHWIEYVWVSFTIVDVIASTSSWLAARADWRRAMDEKRRLIAKHAHDRLITRASAWAVTRAILTSALGNLCVALMLFAAAVFSLFLPPPPPDYGIVRQSLVVISLLIVVTALNTVIAVYGRVLRYRLSVGFYEMEAGLKTNGTSTGEAVVDALGPNASDSAKTVKVTTSPSSDGHTVTLVNIQKTGEETKDIAIDISEQVEALNEKVDAHKAEADAAAVERDIIEDR